MDPEIEKKIDKIKEATNKNQMQYNNPAQNNNSFPNQYNNAYQNNK